MRVTLTYNGVTF